MLNLIVNLFYHININPNLVNTSHLQISCKPSFMSSGNVDALMDRIVSVALQETIPGRPSDMVPRLASSKQYLPGLNRSIDETLLYKYIHKKKKEHIITPTITSFTTVLL